MATGEDVPAKPLKVVAGLEPENTNTFLQLLGKACKAGDASDCVKRVLGGEEPGKASKKKVSSSGDASKAKEEKPADEKPKKKVSSSGDAKPKASEEPKKKVSSSGDAKPKPREKESSELEPKLGQAMRLLPSPDPIILPLCQNPKP